MLYDSIFYISFQEQEKNYANKTCVPSLSVFLGAIY